MRKFTASEVESALEEAYDDYIEWDEFTETPEPLTVDGRETTVSLVEEDLGGEGHGESVYVVLKVGDQLFRKSGYYASHYGTDWDGSFEEVEPQEKTITVYKRKA